MVFRAARRLRLPLSAALAVLVVGLTPAGGALATPSPAALPAGARTAGTVGLASPPRGTTYGCGQQVRPGFARCLSIVRNGIKGRTGLFPVGNLPSGYGPASLQNAYRLPSSTAGGGQTVAIVDAYDDPNAEADLAVYRSQYDLPPCTTANGCFHKVAQDGSTSYPTPHSDWATEISLDLDMVSAVCPKCHILLVEANDDSFTNLGTAVNEAVALGARYVSNSYGAYEGQGLPPAMEASLDALYYNHPGVAVTAASGDSGYGVSYPAASPYVTAVGGTTMTKASSGWIQTAWSYGGSGCSAGETKPVWQKDAGCPKRTVADVSAVADPNTGVAVYDTYLANSGTQPGWMVFGGTSVASPIIASAYALAGTPSAVGYPSSYLYADPSGFKDITKGSNGTCTPAYLCTAGAGYDGPTGLGTPDGVAALGYLRGPRGTLSGTVTGAASGKTVAGATVSVGGYTAITDAAGVYRLPAAPGAHDVTAAAFGYAARTVAGVRVTAGQTSTQNLALVSAPSGTVSGTVTDGSGQHWPLAAKISVPGTPATTYTDPFTGRYQIRLPVGSGYRVQMDPLYPGYQQMSQPVTVRAAGTTQNFAPAIDAAACTAPGYHIVTALTENFAKPALPAGWSIVGLPDNTPGNTWRFDQPDGKPNYYFPGQNYASGWHGANGGGIADIELITPVINMAADAHPLLQLYDGSSVNSMTDSVDVSTDGGKTWATAWKYTGYPPAVSISLPQAADKSSVRLRFHMYDPPNPGIGNQEWQIDEVKVSGCVPMSGGLLAGQVRDGNTGQGIDGATISGAGQNATSVAVPGDSQLSHGFYWMFSGDTGSVPITTAATGYLRQATDVTVAHGKLTQANLTLKAGRIAVTPGSVSATEALGGRSLVKITVRNTGSAPATVHIDNELGGFTPLGQRAVARGVAPLQRIRGRFQPFPIRSGSADRNVASAAAYTDSAPWTPIASLPHGLAGMAAATDPATGRVYVVGGYDAQSFIAQAWTFDPATGQWAGQPSMPLARSGAQAAFIAGKLYVTGGVTGPWDNPINTVPQLEIYDPADQIWTTGAPVPHAYASAATVVLDGEMYVIGGCYGMETVTCLEDDVQVYNPTHNSWSAAAPYPVRAGLLACGAIAGKIYCAGGSNAYGTLKAGYVYDPHANAWHPIASLPIDLWGSAYSAADGRLLLSGGVTANSGILTNQGYSYDPVDNTWTALPNAPEATYEAAGACGFYRIGGIRVISNLTIGWPVGDSYELPGYGGCGGQRWVSADPAATTLAPGQSATITVTLAATAPAVTQPGTYTAALRLGTDTPYTARMVPVTLTVTPPRTWGEIAGTVSGKSCTGSVSPLPGATVQVDGRHGTWPLTTDASGRFALWLDAGNSPLTVITSLTGWQPQAGTVKVRPGAVATDNITLTASGCG